MGFNYVVLEGARVDDISRLFGIRNTDAFQVQLTEGLGFGMVYPRSNTKLLKKERYDEFHIAGVGVNAKAGLHLTFLKHLLIVGELKGGTSICMMCALLPAIDRQGAARFLLL